MTIDVHCHLVVGREEVYNRATMGRAKFFADQLTRLGKPITREEFMRDVLPTILDPKGERIIQKMDEAGIEKTVVFTTSLVFEKDSGYDLLEAHNRRVFELAVKYRDRLVPFCTLDPQIKGIVSLFERSVKEWGVRGLKLDPLAGSYYPSDRAFYPLYEKASELNLPVLFHTGPRPEDPQSRHAHPSYLDQILLDFPDLKIVAAHMSFAYWRDLITLAKARSNLMCDISAFQLTAALNYGQFCHILRRVMDGFGKDRVLFGTDGPTFDIFLSRKEWVQLIKGLPANSPEGSKFTEEEVACLVHSNARNLLGL